MGEKCDCEWDFYGEPYQRIRPQHRTIHIARVNGTWRWFTDCTPT